MLQTSLLALCLLNPGVGLANDSETCRELPAVRVADNPVLDKARADQLTARFLGSCIDATTMREILASISKFLIDEGFITTRPCLLEQDVRDGEIDIEILVGRIEAVVDAETGSSNVGIATAFAFNGDILNLRQLENSLEAIQRPRPVQASVDIRPGSGQGGSITIRQQLRISRPVNRGRDYRL